MPMRRCITAKCVCLYLCCLAVCVREEQSAYEKEVEELRSRVRMLESLSSADPNLMQMAAGLCVRCAQNEAVLAPGGVAGVTQMSVDRLTR